MITLLMYNVIFCYGIVLLEVGGENATISLVTKLITSTEGGEHSHGRYDPGPVSSQFVCPSPV